MKLGDPGYSEMKPDSLVQKVVTNLPIQSDSTKERGSMGAETPAMKGHGNAHSLAKMTAVMACNGELDVP